MSDTEKKVELPATEANPVLVVAEKLFQKTPFMVREYKTLIGHTGGLLATSMSYAYNKGLSDALKLILKEMENGKKN